MNLIKSEKNTAACRVANAAQSDVRNVCHTVNVHSATHVAAQGPRYCVILHGSMQLTPDVASGGEGSAERT